MSKSIPGSVTNLTGQPRPSGAKDIAGFATRARVRELVLLLVCIFLALVFTLPHSPANMVYVYPDSGVFQYVGHRILEGQLIYRDVWDHKPPLIYYLNALGVMLGGDSRWGVWALSFLAVTAAVALSVRLLRRAFSTALALLVTAMWLLAYFQLIEDGNMTEEYALPLQFACLLLAYDVETQHAGHYRGRGLAIGIMVGLIFFLKTNEVGIGVAIGTYLLLKAARAHQWRNALVNLAPLIGGFVLVAAIMLAILYAQGILYYYWDVSILFNLYYSARFAFLTGTLDALEAGYTYLALTGLAQLGILGCASGIMMLVTARERIPASLVPLLEISALALPIEIALVTTTRRTFDHYYVALLYVLAVWTAWLLRLILQAVTRERTTPGAPDRGTLGRGVREQRTFLKAFPTAGLALGIGIMLFPAFRTDYTFAQSLHQLQPPQVVAYIRENTNPEDTILIYGLEPRVLLFAERRAPSRFIDIIPFEITRYVTPAMVEGFFRDVIRNRPALILDPRGFGLNNFTPVNSVKIRREINHLRNEYKLTTKLEGWRIFTRVAGAK